MNKSFALVLLSTAGLAAVTGCTQAERATSLPPGKYESTNHSVDANGTAYDTKQTTTVTKDASGNKNATVETETSKDPKGLFNKSTSTSKSSTSTNRY